MLLSIQQKEILHLLRELGCLHERQLLTLLRGKYSSGGRELSLAAVQTMLRQLRHLRGDIRLENGMAFLDGRKAGPLHLEALDVMLELTGGVPEHPRRGPAPPALLRFSLGGEHIRLFTVAQLTGPSSVQAVQRVPMEHIIWISESGQIPEGLTLPAKHFFAARTKDGIHRFYGSQEL